MIRFTRDGRHVILRDGDALGVVDLDGNGAEKTIRAPGFRDFAAFDDEVWVAAGDPPVLRRYAIAGEPRGVEVPLGATGPGGSLAPVTFGEPAALWLGADRLDLRLEQGAIQARPIAASEAAMVPMTAGRRVELAGGRLTLCGPDGSLPLGPVGGDEDMRLVDGAALFEEKAMALLLTRDGAQMLIVVALPEGTIRHRLSFTGIERACFAPRRGHVVLLIGDRKLSIVDLRFGKILKTWDEPQPVLDLAVDAGARHLVLQREVPGAEPETFYGSYREILGAVSSSVRASSLAAAAQQKTRAQPPAMEAEEAPGQRGSDGDPTEPDPLGGAAPEAAVEAKDDAEHHPAADPAADAKVDAPDGAAPSVGDAARAAAARFSSRPALSGASTTSSAALARRPSARSTPPLSSTRPGGPRPSLGNAAAPPRSDPSRTAGAVADPAAEPAPSSGPAAPRGVAPLRAPPGRPGLAGALRSPHTTPPARPLRPPTPSAPRSLPAVSRPSSPPPAIRRSAPARSVETPPDHAPPAPRDPVPPGSIDDDLLQVIDWCERALSEARATGLALSSAEASTLVDRARDAVAVQLDGGDATPRATLAREFRLSATEADLLLAVAAPSLRGDVGRLYLALSPGGRGCDELFLGQLLGEHRRDAIARSLDEDSPLVGAGLLRIAAGARPFAAVAIDPVIRRRLRGERLPVLDGEARYEVRGPRESIDELVLAEGVASALGEAFDWLLDDVTAGARLVVRAARGSGRRTVLAALAAAAGRAIALLDAGAAHAFPGGLGSALRQAALAGLIPCITGLDGIAGDPGLVGALRAALAGHAGPVALRCPSGTSPSIAGAAANVMTIDLPPPAEAARARLWRRALEARDLPAQAAEDLAARHGGAAAGSIARVVEAVAAEAGSTEPSVLLARIEAALARNRDRHLDGIATRVREVVSAPQVSYPPSVEDGLSALSARVTENWGSAQLHGRASAAACFSGPPGTGKSTAAKLLASELGRALYRVDARALAGRSPGAAAHALSVLGETAAEGPLVLLFERSEALLSSTVPSIQAALDGFFAALEGVAIFEVSQAVTDPRFDLRIDFPLPDAAVREQLFRIHLPVAARGLDVARLAGIAPLCGAAIRDAVKNALLLAAREGAPLSEAHIERAIGFSPG